MNNLTALLGLADSASIDEIKIKFDSLKQKLENASSSKSSSIASQALSKINAAMQSLPHILPNTDSQNETFRIIKPRLGQLCVMTHMISIDQLSEAVDAQRETGEPLGEILEDKNFISHSQLEGLLMGQNLYDMDDYTRDPFYRQLVALDLITEDMAFIAQIDEKVSGQPKGEGLISRGWLDPELLRLFEPGHET
ncbi:hypothetical protein KA183_11175 [bacterium]|nr:hypothetical protein [bacterium]QQR58488.1 MAG: hypothetical protein IPG59_03035 [Candidatus Melainabacteria bacterium]